MISIVTGYMRSGTSMMMQCLIAGGMDAAWSDKRDKFAASFADDKYHPNRKGLFEIPIDEYFDPGFPSKYEGKLIKVMIWGMTRLVEHEYRIIVMRRDPEEIRQSYEGFFDTPLRDAFIKDYHAGMDTIVERLRERKDVKNLVQVGYRDVIENPYHIFHRLSYRWPIDAEKAAAQVDPAQYRFRKELLTVGI